MTCAWRLARSQSPLALQPVLTLLCRLPCAASPCCRSCHHSDHLCLLQHYHRGADACGRPQEHEGWAPWSLPRMRSAWLRLGQAGPRRAPARCCPLCPAALAPKPAASPPIRLSIPPLPLFLPPAMTTFMNRPTSITNECCFSTPVGDGTTMELCMSPRNWVPLYWGYEVLNLTAQTQLPSCGCARRAGCAGCAGCAGSAESGDRALLVEADSLPTPGGAYSDSSAAQAPKPLYPPSSYLCFLALPRRYRDPMGTYSSRCVSNMLGWEVQYPAKSRLCLQVG